METKDRELLELAAKACGELTPSWYNNENYFNGVLSRWNPLEDDGDAFRLAVTLNLIGSFRLSHFTWVESENINKLSATRRAIVRAAAEIGKERQ